ncbi:MAG: type II secretion system protein [Okeania sp. SIO2C2]|uniref:hormogonium polysaccharide secretion pseudopilin HpsB n=1 Tax=Okeania sp. SIO2C2 TaxID=2607787 RepID=UPI0013B88B15|nr:hormogonium polysaccharide secretion pseudopilin HpsB [Okeania sp. SIO2C2]NEP85419.1 type II secretion system protein [Okeania sp. SIO2C2]
MIKYIKMPKPHSSESGYTIMESLVAMIVVATLMSAIAPVIAISVGTRVQARRIELAAQAARSYIDGVRAGSIPAPEMAAVLPSSIADDIGGPATLVCPNPPDQNAYCTTTVNAGGADAALYCVDGGDGGDCTGLTDMVVYALGFNNTGNADNGYELFVRVYRGSGVEGAKLSRQLISTSVSNTGLATRSGNREKPLFTTRTEIAPSGDNLFQKYRDRLN